MIESTSMASLLTERCYRSTPRGVLTAHAWWLCQCETGACQYHWCSIYRGLERLAPGCLVAQSVGISWLWRLKSDATGSIPAGWVRGVAWVPIFLYSSILTSLRKENHLDTYQLLYLRDFGRLVSYSLLQSPIVSHSPLKSPTVSYSLPQSLTVSHGLLQSPIVSHSLLQSPTVSYSLPLSPIVSYSLPHGRL